MSPKAVEAFDTIMDYLKRNGAHSEEARGLYKEVFDLLQRYDIVFNSEDDDLEEIQLILREIDIIKNKIINLKETIQWN